MHGAPCGQMSDFMADVIRLAMKSSIAFRSAWFGVRPVCSCNKSVAHQFQRESRVNGVCRSISVCFHMAWHSALALALALVGGVGNRAHTDQICTGAGTCSLARQPRRHGAALIRVAVRAHDGVGHWLLREQPVVRRDGGTVGCGTRGGQVRAHHVAGADAGDRRC